MGGACNSWQLRHAHSRDHDITSRGFQLATHSPVIQESVDHSLKVFAFLDKFIAGGIQFILRPFSHPGSTELVLVGNIKDSISRDQTSS